MVKQDPKTTQNYLLGQIATDVSTIKARQVEIQAEQKDFRAEIHIEQKEFREFVEKKINALQLEVDEIREDRTYTKGKVAGLSGGIAFAISTLGWLINKLF